MIMMRALAVSTNLQISYIELIFLEKTIGIIQVYIALTNGFNFRSEQLHTRNIFLRNMILKRGSLVDNI